MAYVDAKMIIHPAWEAQIALLIVIEVIILAEYLDFTDVFLKKAAAKLLQYSDINKYAINLEPNK